MTPLQIKILLHYYTCVDGYGRADDNRKEPAVIEAISQFMRNGMLKPSPEGLYTVTDRGKAYIDALRSMPLPVCEWRVPETGEE